VAKPVIITPMQQPGFVGGRAEIVHTLSLEDRLRGAAINHKTETAKFHGGKILRLFETSVVIISSICEMSRKCLVMYKEFQPI
jgi:hypothetical protein